MSRPVSSKSETIGSSHGSGGNRAAFVARLQVILRHWPSADRLARHVGVSPSAFRKWLKGEAEPSRERLIALADAAQVNVGWLAKGDGPDPDFGRPDLSRGGDFLGEHGEPTRPAASGGNTFEYMPRPEGFAEDGPAIHPTNSPGFIALRHDWLRATFGAEPQDLSLETVDSDAMAPTIASGDLVMVDTSARDTTRCGIYLLKVGTRRLFRRVQLRLDGSLLLISDNERYQSELILFEHASGVAIVGRVVWAARVL